MKLATILVAGCLAWCCGLTAGPGFAASEGDVSVWVTSADRTQLLAQQPHIAFEDAGRANVMIDPTHRFQEIEGFGGALTDSSAWLISTVLSAEMHRRVMHDLFDLEGGIGVSYVRVAI